MEAIFMLVPISLAIVFASIAVFVWAVNNFQFDDLEKEAERILSDDEVGPTAPLNKGVTK